MRGNDWLDAWAWVLFGLLPIVLAIFPLLAAAVVSWLCVRRMRWERDSALLRGPAGGCLASVGVVGLYLLVYFLLAMLPSKPGGGGGPWGGGRLTVAAVVFVAGNYGLFGALVGGGVTFLVWLTGRLAARIRSAVAARREAKVSQPDSADRQA